MHDQGIFLEGAEVEPCLAESDAVESVKGKVKRDIGKGVRYKVVRMTPEETGMISKRGKILEWGNLGTNEVGCEKGVR